MLAALVEKLCAAWTVSVCLVGVAFIFINSHGAKNYGLKPLNSSCIKRNSVNDLMTLKSLNPSPSP